ncbi:MAG: 3-deoxy-D-manno-octulosonic acid transferase [Fidelibacterota bacterium]
MFGLMVNQKIREGFLGRLKSIRLLKDFNASLNPRDLTYWFHAASFGEYEQIRPVLAGLKAIEPHAKIVVSFFSPSGYNNVKDDRIDCKIYLPFDFPWTIHKALKLVHPKKIIFAAYDIWPNLVWIAKSRNIRTTLFAARFMKGTKKLYPVFRNFYQSVYSGISAIYTVDKDDYLQVGRLIQGNPSILRVLGNPRYDQVKEKADEFTVSHTQSVLDREKRIIAGSVHLEDEPVVLDAFADILKQNKDVSLVWIPHDPDKKNILRAERFFSEKGIMSVRLWKKTIQLPKAKVVIVDVVGILSRLYWHGQIAYIGGGFSTGVHNTMEPAIARLPVLFGPKNEQFHATGELIKSGGGFEIHSSDDVYTILDRLISNQSFFLKSSFAATNVIHKNLGSATRVVRGIVRD